MIGRFHRQSRETTVVTPAVAIWVGPLGPHSDLPKSVPLTEIDVDAIHFAVDGRYRLVSNAPSDFKANPSKCLDNRLFRRILSLAQSNPISEALASVRLRSF